MKFFSRVCIALVALFCCGVASAKELQDVVYLKNGSIIRGTIIEQVPNESLKIKTADGSVFVYEISQVDKYAKEEPVLKSKGLNPRVKGYRGWVETGGAVGLGTFGDGVFTFSTSHGYQFSPYFFLGAGIGVDYHFGWETVFMPIFANARAYFIDGKISPFMDVKIGYSPVDDSGLFYFTPSVGVSFGTSKKCAVNLSIGYNLQRVMMYVYRYVPEYDHYNLLYDSRESLHGLSFKLGFEF